MQLLSFKIIALMSVFYILLGMVIVSSLVPYFSNTKQSNKVEFLSPQTIIQVEIPKFDLIIPVSIGTYQVENDSWNISDNMAYFAQESAALMSNSGNTIIYAHNKHFLFGKIAKLDQGDNIFITDENGKVKEFTFSSKLEVNPRDTTVFDSTEAYQLVLLTCSGYLDQKRMLVYFTPIKE